MIRFLLLFIVLLAGCATKLPVGSYVEGRTGYSKDTGGYGKAMIHIPLALKDYRAIKEI